VGVFGTDGGGCSWDFVSQSDFAKRISGNQSIDFFGIFKLIKNFLWAPMLPFTDLRSQKL